MVEPAVSQVVSEYGRDPFLVLISCLLSLRAKDTMSLPVSRKLFEIAKTPHELLSVFVATLQRLIYPVGFYRKKAQLLHDVSNDIINRFGGKVPQTLDELLSIKGVGLKTANLVLGEAFGVPAICVDTHVHRISNRLGLVKTKTPEQTEAALKKIVPKKYWIEYNKLFVLWGQNVCLSVGPLCLRCILSDLCPKIGVKKHR